MQVERLALPWKQGNAVLGLHVIFGSQWSSDHIAAGFGQRRLPDWSWVPGSTPNWAEIPERVEASVETPSGFLAFRQTRRHQRSVGCRR